MKYTEHLETSGMEPLPKTYLKIAVAAIIILVLMVAFAKKSEPNKQKKESTSLMHKLFSEK